MKRQHVPACLLLLFLALPIVSIDADQEVAIEAGQDAEDRARAVGGLTFVDEYELTIANLVVYVTNKAGKAITDLTREDFQVLQDGSEKEITNFQLYTDEIIRHQFEHEILPGPTPTPVPDAAPQPDPIEVHMVLYIDNENLDPLDRNRVLAQTREFVLENVHPPARMMVVSYQRSFTVLQDFTSNANEVLAAMRSVRKHTGGRTSRDSEKKDILSKIREYREQERSNSGYSDTNTGQYHTVYRLIDGYAKEEANNLLFSLDSIRHVITSLSGLPGKKGIIYVSNGLPMIPGMDLFYEISRVYQDSTMLTQITRFDRTRLFQELANTANAQDVTLYTIGAGGLEMHGVASAESRVAQDPLSASVGAHNYTDSLAFMADETGGVAILNTNDVTKSLERIKQDMYTYYSLGYPLQASGKDKVHRVKISLPNHPQYKLRYRSRFVEKSLETRVQDKVVSSLMFDVDDNLLHVDVETGSPAPASKERWMLPVHVSFPLDKVALLPEGEEYVGRVMVFYAVRDQDGKRSDLVRQEHEVRIPAADYDLARSKRFGIDNSLLMEAGRYRLAVALIDQVTHQDSYQLVTTSVHPEELR